MSIQPDIQTGYLLHRWQYQETSLILAFWTKELGITRCLSLGALRPRKRLFSVLRPFQQLEIAQKGTPPKLMKLVHVSVRNPFPILSCPKRFAIGSYLNELALKCLPEYTPEPQLYGCYEQLMQKLMDASIEQLAAWLTAWEWDLVGQLGYACSLPTTCVEGDTCELYELGYELPSSPDLPQRISAQTVQHLRQQNFMDPMARKIASHITAKKLMQHLGTVRLRTRGFVQQLGIC